MLRNDEIIALNVLMFAERWRLPAWLDIRWSEETGQYSTFLLYSLYNPSAEAVEDESECEITSLEELNILLASEAEFYRNVTTLVSIGALEAHDIEVESLVKVIVDRITGESNQIPYLYSMSAGEFTPTEDFIYKFDELETVTGRLALEAIRVMSRTGEWWGEMLVIRHIDKDWSRESHEFIPLEEKYFSVEVLADDMYHLACHETVELTEDNFDVFVSAVDDIASIEEDVFVQGFSRNFWTACLFCERSEEFDEELTSFVRKNMPVELTMLFPVRESQRF